MNRLTQITKKQKNLLKSNKFRDKPKISQNQSKKVIMKNKTPTMLNQSACLESHLIIKKLQLLSLKSQKKNNPNKKKEIKSKLSQTNRRQMQLSQSKRITKNRNKSLALNNLKRRLRKYHVALSKLKLRKQQIERDLRK